MQDHHKQFPETAAAAEAAAAASSEQPKASQPPQPPPNVKPCRYGGACSRPDCKFWHPENADTQRAGGGGGGAASVDVDVGAQCSKLGLSWIPLHMVIYLHENGKVSYGDQPDPAVESPVVDCRKYEL